MVNSSFKEFKEFQRFSGFLKNLKELKGIYIKEFEKNKDLEVPCHVVNSSFKGV